MVVPKIIHQTAPKERCEWHPIWKKCHMSWKTFFPQNEYQHMMWTDEDIESFVKNEYSEYYTFFNNLPFHIMQLDFFRYCVLHKYGGIYADMDMYCYQNFYNDLEKNCYLIESPHEGETVQNSLMISSVNNHFYLYCIEETIQKYISFDKEITYELILNPDYWCPYVLKNMGPIMLTSIYDSYADKKTIGILPQNQYNSQMTKYNNNLKTKHILTGRWGRELIYNLKQRHLASEMKNKSHLEYLKWDFKNFRGIDVDSFDFYS